MSEVIYIALERETWRPVHADRITEEVYEIAVDEVPEGENWPFPPRSRVRCCEHVFPDGTRALLAYELADTSG